MNRYSAFWTLGDTLDAGYAALEGMLLTSGKEAVDERKPAVLSFLRECFDRDESRFATDSSRRTRGLFATHTAIGVMRSLAGLHSDQRLTRTRFEATLREMGISDGSRALEEIETLVQEARSGDAVVENPQKRLIPTLTALYTASSILWYLGEGDEDFLGGLVALVKPRRLERFLTGCLKRQRVDDYQVAGFAIHPDHSELCVNTTYFGLKLMQRLGIPRLPEWDPEIEKFLELSCKEGGFSSTRPEPRSLNATFWGLRGLEIVSPPDRWASFVARHREAVKGFIDSCWDSRSGGARFAADATRFVENCLATRYWLQIHDLLGFPLTGPERAAAFAFFRNQFDDRTGGFRGYPEERMALDHLTQADVESYLDEKDEKLLAYHRERSERPGASPYPGTHVIELYERLADLEEARCGDGGDAAAIDEEIGRTWDQLRSWQKAEAARFEAAFDEDVLGPIREGLRRVTEIDARLSQP